MNKTLFLHFLIGLLSSLPIAGLFYFDRPQPLYAETESHDPSHGSPSTPQPMMQHSDRHFLEMMLYHHQGTIEMVKLAPSRSKHPEMLKLADSMLQTQTREMSQLQSWYKSWYDADSPTATEGGPQHHSRMLKVHQDTGMMGMYQGRMSMKRNLEGLKNASDFDREFIRHMTIHHQKEVHMAQRLLQHTTRPEMKNLAQLIIKSRTDEISQMQKWNQAWYQ